MRKRTLAAALLLLSPAAIVRADTPPVKPVPPIVQKYISAVQNARTLSVDVARLGTGGTAAEKVHLVMVRPNKIKMVSEAGGRTISTLVSDGKTLYQWDRKQYIKQDAPPTLDKMNPALPGGIASVIASVLFINPEMIRGAPNLRDTGAATIRGTAVHKVLSNGDGSKTTFWIASATGLPAQITLGGDGREYTFSFTNYAVGRAVADSTFAAVPPKNLIAYTPPQQPELLKAGTPAPDFTLQTPDGKSVSLSSLKGRVVLIDFWASWCGPCKMAMPHVQKLHEELGGKGLTVLSVNSWDRKPDMDKFLKENPQYTTTMLFDPNNGDQSIASSKYKVSGIPTVYLIDKDGNVAASFVGYDPDGENQIKAALAKLGVQ